MIWLFSITRRNPGASGFTWTRCAIAGLFSSSPWTDHRGSVSVMIVRVPAQGCWMKAPAGSACCLHRALPDVKAKAPARFILLTGLQAAGFPSACATTASPRIDHGGNDQKGGRLAHLFLICQYNKRYIEEGKIKPLLSKTFKLSNIIEAQKEFLKKNHFGNFVLIP